METRNAAAKTDPVPLSVAPKLRKPSQCQESSGELGTAGLGTASPQLSAALWSWDGPSNFLRISIKRSVKMVSELLETGEFIYKKVNIFKLFT